MFSVYMSVRCLYLLYPAILLFSVSSLLSSCWSVLFFVECCGGALQWRSACKGMSMLGSGLVLKFSKVMDNASFIL